MIRGTPLLVQLFIIFYALPQFGIVIDPFPAAVIAFSLNVGGYAAEVIRGGDPVHPAGASGRPRRRSAWTTPTTLRRVILPQAARTAVPPLSNTLISLVKDTSLASTILVTELLRVAQLAAAPTFEFFALYGVAAVYYWVICLVLSFVQDQAGDPTGRYVARMTEPAWTVPRHRALRKAFGDHEVLRGISFDVPAGTVTAVIGPSGSGKTTVLRTLNALDQADAGVVRSATCPSTSPRRPDRATLARFRAQSGMVFQAHNLFPHMTVLQNVHRGPGRGAAPAGGRGARGRRWRCWTQVGLAEKADQYPYQLSGRPAAARRDRPGAGAAAQADAVRRADLGAGPGARRRGAAGDEGPGRGGLDDGRGDPRDPVRPAGRRPGAVHRRRRGASSRGRPRRC